jgi:hypothetical protein
MKVLEKLKTIKRLLQTPRSPADVCSDSVVTVEINEKVVSFWININGQSKKDL